MSIDSPIQTRKLGGKRLALGLVSMFSVAAIGFSGTTFAVGNGDAPNNGAPKTKEDCKKDGWKKYGFKNQGQCVKWVKNNGNGYGGGNNNEISTSINLIINGSNNVINIVIHYILG